MVFMFVVEVAIVEVVHMVTVLDSLMATAFAMLVVMVSVSLVALASHDFSLIPVAVMLVMDMAVMQVVQVVAVLDGLVAAALAVLVVVVVMDVMCHLFNLLFLSDFIIRQIAERDKDFLFTTLVSSLLSS